MFMLVSPLLITGQSQIMGFKIHSSKIITQIAYVLMGFLYIVLVTISLNEMIRGAHQETGIHIYEPLLAFKARKLLLYTGICGSLLGPFIFV
jgi:hypothetical protein